MINKDLIGVMINQLMIKYASKKFRSSDSVTEVLGIIFWSKMSYYAGQLVHPESMTTSNSNWGFELEETIDCFMVHKNN